MQEGENIYGPFRSETTYEITGFLEDEYGVKNFDHVIEQVDEIEELEESTISDLVEIYGEETVEDYGLSNLNEDYTSHIDVEEGAGCTEIWEHLSEQRAQD